jgi:hypothetical protein
MELGLIKQVISIQQFKFPKVYTMLKCKNSDCLPKFQSYSEAFARYKPFIVEAQ